MSDYKLDGYELDNTPGCGGWVVELRGRIIWPLSLGKKTQEQAESVAATISGARAVRVDIVLRKPDA